MKDERVDPEDARLATLRGYNILDTEPEREFDEIAQLASEICETPIALISFLDKDRQWFKSAIGTDRRQTDIDSSICAHAVQAKQYLEIEDTTTDDRTVNNPLVAGEDKVRFYAGALLEGDQGLPLGTLCVLDHAPRQLTPVQQNALRVLANQVMRQIELRRALTASEVLSKEVDHRVKNSLQSLEALIRIQTRGETSPDARAALEAVQGRLSMISNLHEALYMAEDCARVSMQSFLQRVVEAAAVQMPRDVQVECKIAPYELEPRDASSIGMIVNEAIANAGKYAFAQAQAGLFEVLGQREKDHYTLICRDDGAGPGVAGQPEGTGMGMRIMQAAAQQLGGALEVGSVARGYALTLRWPVAG